MKSKIYIACLVLVLGLAGATLALAQGSAMLDQNGPLGGVGWSSSAPLCVLPSASAPATVDYVNGAVSFTKTSSGTIVLLCSMNTIGNGLTPTDINAVALTFSNNGGAANSCTIVYEYVDRSTGDVAGWNTGTQVFNGIWTANVGLTMVPNHTYDIDIYLYRPKAAVKSCNPTVYGVFMETIIQ